MPEHQPPPPKMMARRRVSVSAECYTIPAKPTERKVVDKAESARERIRTAMGTNVLFSGMDEDQISEVVDSVEEAVFAPGATIIQQGDWGDHF